MDEQVTATDALFIAFMLAKHRGVDVNRCHSLDDLWTAYLDQLSPEEFECIRRNIKSPMLRKGIESRVTHH